MEIYEKQKTTDDVIKSNEKWFDFFMSLPLVITVLYAIEIFVVAIVFGTNIADEYYYLLFALFLTPGVFAIFKVVVSYPILHICYLKKLSNSKNATESENDELPDKLPEI